MAQQTVLNIEGINNSSNELKTLSADVAELCKTMYDEIKALKETKEFKTMNASELYFQTIDNLNGVIPKYTDDVLKFSEFLSNYVLTNYEETDQEAKAEIENDLEESLEQLENVNELGNGVNLDKISASAQGALNGDFIDSSKLKKSMFEDGELEFKVREDGSVQIVKNGTVLGYTTQDGITNGSVSTQTEASVTQTAPTEQTPSANPVTEASTAASIGIATATTANQIAPTINPGTVSSGYSGSLHTKAKATDGVKSTAGTITTGHQTYSIVPDSQYNNAPGTISESDYNLLVAQVAGESANSKDDMLGVACTVLNRLEAGNFGGSVHEVLQKGYFPWGESYKSYVQEGKSYTTTGVANSSGQYASTGWGQEKLQEVTAAVNDALGGARNVESNVFYYSGNGEYNKFSDIV